MVGRFDTPLIDFPNRVEWERVDACCGLGDSEKLKAVKGPKITDVLTPHINGHGGSIWQNLDLQSCAATLPRLGYIRTIDSCILMISQ
jgi:hypothetical protein